MTRNHFSQVDAFTNAAMRNGLLLIMLSLTFARPSFAQTEAPEKQTQLAQKSTFIPSVADVVTNYVNAIGGTTAWERLKTQLAKGTFENDQMGPGSNALEVFKKAPDKWRFTIRGSDGGVMQHGFIRFKEIRHNVSIDDSKFERPKSL